MCASERLIAGHCWFELCWIVLVDHRKKMVQMSSMAAAMIVTHYWMDIIALSLPVAL